MKKALTLFGVALALTLGPLAARAHGPGNGLLWMGKPWAGIVHTHCSTLYNVNEFFVTAAGQSVGVGKHSQNPAVVDWYVIAPGALGQDPAPGDASPCGDGLGIP
jgi:hypothetical protein